MGHHAATPAHAGHVYLAHSGELQYGAHVVGIDPGTGHQAGTARQHLLHGLQSFQPRQRGRRMTRAQDALAAGSDYRLQIQPPVGGKVNGAMEGDAERPGRSHQLAQLVGGHPPLLIQQADHYPLQPGGAGGGDIRQHQFKLVGAEAKIPGAGADHGVDGDAGVACSQLHKAIRGGQATQSQRRAKLDAIRACLLGGEQGFQVVDTNFKTGHDDSFIGEIRQHI